MVKGIHFHHIINKKIIKMKDKNNQYKDKDQK
jgi:hypothetical protein